ncbi:T9SS type A sorting domain-containing protein [Taibaiella soli]|uniref:Secretion system C-terminal sorting domain-containing protein n=1 Tax=Taibaiella soli TaxID=1649169 RepID=A0A2W2AFX9_9BACT|nr:T9SS type A sorting domain-containing protein [Taibaiella soli]PZF72422.1 hypothetical protein DN068_13805 [Taibaiella soli]
MKKFILLTLAGAISFGSFAQNRVAPKAPQTKSTLTQKTAVSSNAMLQRTTNTFDTASINYIQSTDTVTLYGESGFGAYYGLNVLGLNGYAERFDVANSDTSVSVLGVVARFGGMYNTASTKTVTFRVWNQSAPVAIDANNSLIGLPDNVMGSSNAISVKNLGMGNGAAPDTAKIYALTTPTAYMTTPFFVGYEVPYDTLQISGDTLGLYSTIDGERHTGLGYVSNGDTTYITQNVIKAPNNQWYDNYLEVYNIYNHLYIYPVVSIQMADTTGGGGTTGVPSVTKGNLTFFGNYPNPAVNNTNIKFSLKNTTDITIQILDMNGRVLNTINQSKLGAGDHVINVETSSLAAGNYIYTMTTGGGDRLASQMSVVK